MKKSPHTGGLGNQYGWHRQNTPSCPDAHAIKAAVPPVVFYSAELSTMPPPKRGGWVDGGLCPFHDDTTRGNFRVNADTGAFRCFACGAKGADVLAFVMQRHGWTFREALASLAESWGVR